MLSSSYPIISKSIKWCNKNRYLNDIFNMAQSSLFVTYQNTTSKCPLPLSSQLNEFSVVLNCYHVTVYFVANISFKQRQITMSSFCESKLMTNPFIVTMTNFVLNKCVTQRRRLRGKPGGGKTTLIGVNNIVTNVYFLLHIYHFT